MYIPESAAPDVSAIETRFSVPAIVAGTPQPRVFSRAFPADRHAWRDEVVVDNNRGAATLTVKLNGDQVYTVAPGAVTTFDKVSAQGSIRFYTVDADANVAADVVQVAERRGPRGAGFEVHD